MAGTTISFNSTSLQTDNIITSKIQHDQIPNRSVSVKALAYADGSKITNTQFTSKSITVEGKLLGSSIQDLDDRLEALRAALSGDEKNLDIGYSSGTRRYVATLENFVSSRYVKDASWSAQFLVAGAFGKDTTVTTALANTTLTASGGTTTMSAIGGTYTALPIIYLTLNSGSGLSTNKFMKITNPSTGKAITVTRASWTGGDAVIINCDTKTVTFNGTSIDYAGVFPELAVGETSIQYSDDFTTRNVTIKVDYTKRYL